MLYVYETGSVPSDHPRSREYVLHASFSLSVSRFETSSQNMVTHEGEENPTETT